MPKEGKGATSPKKSRKNESITSQESEAGSSCVGASQETDLDDFMSSALGPLMNFSKKVPRRSPRKHKAGDSDLESGSSPVRKRLKSINIAEKNGVEISLVQSQDVDLSGFISTNAPDARFPIAKPNGDEQDDSANFKNERIPKIIETSLVLKANPGIVSARPTNGGNVNYKKFVRKATTKSQ